MDFPSALLIAIGAAAGGFINGLAGFGTALFALGFFLTVLPPVQSVALVVSLSIITGVQGLWAVRQSIRAHPTRPLWLLIPGIFGIFLGVKSLLYVDVGTLKLVIAGFLLIYGGFFTTRRNLPRLQHPPRWIDIVIGFVGGVLGGLAGLSGALPTIWYAMRAWPKTEIRAVLQCFNMGILCLTALILALRGAYSAETIGAMAIAIPMAVIFAQLGVLVFNRIPDALFQRLLIVLCFISGIILLVRELL